MSRPHLFALGLALLVAVSATADTITLYAKKDSTLYQSGSGSLANGAGEYLFAGLTAQTSNRIRRILIQFDVATSLPANATIVGASLRLYCSKTNTPAETFTLHRLTASWNEGIVNDSGDEGDGASAQNGDSTWVHRNRPTSQWTTSGGDYLPTVSAETTVFGESFPYFWGSTPQMVADVQDFLNNPADNHGWLIKGNDSVLGGATAKRFDSRTFNTSEPTITVPDKWPRLIITYITPATLDLNCDSFLDSADCSALALALVNPAGFAAAYPGCDVNKCDVDGNGIRNGHDVQKYVEYYFP